MAGVRKLNVRTGPDTAFERVGQLSPGEEIEVTGRTEKGDWLQLLFEEEERWVSAAYAELNVPPEDIPVIPDEELPRKPAVAKAPSLAAGATRVWEKDGSTLVYVPAGEFLMGSEGDPDAHDDELPQHAVYLDAFWIDQTEVTNAQFSAFLNQQGNRMDGGFTWLDLEGMECLIEREGDGFRPKNGFAAHPVMYVCWYGASAYCDWAAKRLPTEA